MANARRKLPTDGLRLLATLVAAMWALELVNTLDSNHLDADGIYPRDVGRLWGIVTAPFLHVSFAHLIANTIPFVFMGLIIAVAGAKRLAAVTAIVALLGGLGTWLIAPAHNSVGQPEVVVGASGVVFGYATYLLTRGLFNRRLLEILVGAVVGAVWGGALLASVVPHYGISWQGHVCGAIAGVVAARMLMDRRATGARPHSGAPAVPAAPKP